MNIVAGVPNLAQVVPRIWRGGQPRDAIAWAYLRGIGVTNVIKLNTEPGDELAELPVARFPITTPQQIWGPVAAQLEGALVMVTEGTYIHCEFGKNRTGTLVILYRIKVCGWSKWRAIMEAYRYGWWSTFPALREYIYQL